VDIFSEEPGCRGGVEKKQGTTITRYIRDASGNVMAVYQADTLSERPIYGSSRLGNLSYASKPGYRTVGHKQYELSNHLGNVLAVVSDRIRMKTDSTWTQVLSRTDYYPFGLEMTGRTESATYRYGFNGKEKDPSGLWSNQSHYDYGFRIYNPSIAKFLSVDPLAKEFPWNSTYAFAENDVIRSIDLEGLEKLIITSEANSFFSEFQRVVKSDQILNQEVLLPISKEEKKESTHIYFGFTNEFGYLNSSKSKGVFYKSSFLKEIVLDIKKYEAGDKLIRSKYTPQIIQKNKKMFIDSGIDINEIATKLNKGIEVYFVLLNRSNELRQNEKTVLHEIYLHLKKFEKSSFEEDHKEGFGKNNYMKSGKKPYWSPEEPPANSKMYEIQKRYENAKNRGN